MMYSGLLSALALFCVVGSIHGLAHMASPPARGTEFGVHPARHVITKTVSYSEYGKYNYEKHPQNCGGWSWQYQMQNGACGVCGDATGTSSTGIELRREHEAGGIYATGTITNKYREGDIMEAVVELKDNNGGWMEWRICAVNDPSKVVEQSCLDKHLLTISGSSETRFMVQPDMATITVELQLPANLNCTHCVVQWKYNAGNLYAKDDKTGEKCMGCGDQEQTYNCADVTIRSDDTSSSTTVSGSSTTASAMKQAVREVDREVDGGFGKPREEDDEVDGGFGKPREEDDKVDGGFGKPRPQEKPEKPGKPEQF